jgi:AraC-like DNA-binding protein
MATARRRRSVVTNRLIVPGVASPPGASRLLAQALRAYLDEHLFHPVTMVAAAEELQASPTRLAKAFTVELGIAPHAYVVGRRLEAARERILRGQPIADVAAEVGFHDQAHLSRRFRQFLGTTPGRFGRSGRSDRSDPMASIAAGQFAPD